MDLTTELYRFGVALSIGALVGFERQSRFEQTPESYDGNDSGPEAVVAPEDRIRAAISASESARYPLQTPQTPVPAVDAVRPDSTPGRNWVPDFQQAVGLRTFILLALSGALAARVSGDSPWIFGLSLLVVGAMIAASYVGSIRTQGDIGITSEISAFCVFLLGGLCTQGSTELAGALGVLITVTLALKQGLHLLAQKIRKEDIQAVLKFAVLTLIILPILPQEPIPVGKYLSGGDVAVVASGDAAGAGNGGVAAIVSGDVAGAEVASVDSGVATGALPEASDTDGGGRWWASLSISPRKIWYMVILISGISFSGFVLGKLLGTGRGLILTGVVGGLASSTAVSLSYSQKSTESPELSRQFAIGILLANAIMPVRLLVVVGVIALPLLSKMALPLLAMSVVGGLAALVLHVKSKENQGQAEIPLKNPFEIGPAIQFGVLFGVVLFIAQIAQGFFGDTGVYAVAVLAGLTDVDAISLAAADLVSTGSKPVVSGAITIALAAISNTLVKGGFVATMGSPQLRKITLLSFGLMTAAAGLGIVGLVVLG
jgi:uncharacterized membrane protein (DUF4010 family)